MNDLLAGQLASMTDPSVSGMVLEHLLDSCPFGVVVVNSDGMIMRGNPRFTQLSGIEEAEFRSRRIENLDRLLAERSDPVAPYQPCNLHLLGDIGRATACASSCAASCNEKFVCDQPVHAGECGCDIVLVRPWRQLRRTISPCRFSADCSGAILFFQDITREAQADRLKNEFLISAAHELRTPMTAIHGFAELLLTSEFDELETAKIIRSIYRQARGLTVTVNDLLALAQLDSLQSSELVLAPLDLGQLAMRACGRFMPEDDVRRPSVQIGQRGVRIRGDEDRLTKAIHEVLSNAYRYSFGRGEIAVRVVAPPNPGWASLQIVDQGIGMSEEESRLAIERFWRADKSGSTPGTGLGMSLVQQIIRLHGGELSIESTPGEGTTVTMLFPLPGMNFSPLKEVRQC